MVCRSEVTKLQLIMGSNVERQNLRSARALISHVKEKNTV